MQPNDPCLSKGVVAEHKTMTEVLWVLTHNFWECFVKGQCNYKTYSGHLTMCVCMCVLVCMHVYACVYVCAL